jgi:hypothetical protein
MTGGTEVLAPFGGPAAWRGEDLTGSTEWVHRLSSAEIDELDAALAHVESRGIPLTELRRDDFPLSTLAAATARWADEVDTVRGFVLVRGVPVDRYTVEQAGIVYYGLGLHLGVPVAQNADGDLLGHVRDTGDDPNDPTVRRYRTREPQPFHTDGSDVVGLLCLQPAKLGGLSSVASSTAIFDEVLRRRPELTPLWFEPWPFDAYGQQATGRPPWFEAPLARVVEGRLRVFYARWYIDKAQAHDGVKRLTADHVALLDLIDELAADPAFRLDMDFEPGDIQLLSNHTVLHARTGYDDWDDPTRKRHLLRLWLTLHRHAIGGIGWGGIDQAHAR